MSTPRATKTALAATAIAMALAVTTLVAPAASAAPRPSTYQRVSHTFTIRPYQADGGYVACPPGKRVVAGGAFFHRPGRAPYDPFVSAAHIVASTPTFDGKAWYALGGNGDLGHVNEFTVVAHCVPKAQVDGSRLVAYDFEANENTPTPPGGYISCPTGYRAYTGGAFMHKPGRLSEPGDTWLYNSTATFDGKGWYADGLRSLNRIPQDLTVVAHCLPRAQLQQARLVVRNIDVGERFETVGSYVSCPPRHRVITGGAFWHRVGQPLDPEHPAGTVVSSSATFDAKGWFAAGIAKNARLTIVARCLPV